MQYAQVVVNLSHYAHNGTNSQPRWAQKRIWCTFNNDWLHQLKAYRPRPQDWLVCFYWWIRLNVESTDCFCNKDVLTKDFHKLQDAYEKSFSVFCMYRSNLLSLCQSVGEQQYFPTLCNQSELENYSPAKINLHISSA